MKKLWMTVFCMLFIYAASAKGSYVTLADSGWAMAVNPGEVAGSIAMPYVYEVTADAVGIELDKAFNYLPPEKPLAPFFVEFHKISSDATLNIVIEDKYITNNTGRKWFDFHMHLMVDSLTPQAGFDPGYVPDGGQFEQVYYDINFGYNGQPIQLNFIDTSGNGTPSSPQ